MQTLEAVARCQMAPCPSAPRAALRLPSGTVAHLCTEHLLETLTAGAECYPVVEVIGVAIVPEETTASTETGPRKREPAYLAIG